MSTSSVTNPIFCCGSASILTTPAHIRLHYDPNRELHDAIFHSFITFATRRQRSADLLCLLTSCLPGSPASTPGCEIVPFQAAAPVFTYEALQNNPLTAQIPYVIHLVARHDFGAVYDHRYFVCPQDLQQDWVEISKVQWFARGKPFDMKAERWDLKCAEDGKFFRLTLRPNLAMRGCYPVSVGTVQDDVVVRDEGTMLENGPDEVTVLKSGIVNA